MSTPHPPHAVLNITEEMPDIVRYPPPFSTRIVQTKTEGTRFDSILRLEQVWQPLWDTYRFQDPVERIAFFLNPAGRPPHDTNVPTGSQLSWPREYYPCELSIRLGMPGAMGFVKEYKDALLSAAEGLADNAVVTFRIGEKNEFQCPLWGMYNPSTLEWKAPLLAKVRIPSVQNFTVVLNIANWSLPPKTAIRCMLNGYLLRELS